MDVAAAAQAVVDRLTAGGVRATLDERDINPPCVFVGPPAVVYRFGRGDYTAEWTAWAVTGAAGRNVDLTNLGALLQAVGVALDWASVRADPYDLPLPHQAAPLPAYRMTWTETVRDHPSTEPRG